ncbi:arsenic resistance N-acetyltransferase ArsN2 [Fodinibius sp. SL11]|uniref:arsenic resistance N-acetyltransferase ArsN2 n=1 Tax=Fodinibius sp. SL11 TaxID=3425690 RepID=UPI003F885916
MNTQMDYQIEKAKLEELSTVRNILEGCGLPSRDLTNDHMQHFFIVKGDTEPIGTIGLEIYNGHGLLRSLAVRSDHRGSGLGTVLVRNIESYAKKLGIDAMYLLTTTADRFFQDIGYKELSRKEIPEVVLQSDEFAQICPSSAVAMTKDLGQDERIYTDQS